MSRFTPFPLLALLASCATQPYEWQFATTECRDLGLSGALFVPEAAELGLADIRIGRLPDTGRGPGVAIQFIRNYDFSGQVREPEIIVAVGDWGNRTCTMRMAESDCEGARTQYLELAALSLPVGHRFDDPVGINLLHGTQYFLASVDGESNELYWSYYGEYHPVLAVLDQTLEALSQCTQGAQKMYSNGI